MNSEAFQTNTVKKPKSLTRRGVERRLALLETAYTLFLKNGYDDVTLDDIIQETGGSKTSIYQYFGDKDGLFRATCDHHFSQKTQNFSVEFQASDNLKTYLQHLLLNFCKAINQERDIQFFHLIIQQSRTKPELMADLNQRWCNEVQRNIENILAKYHEQQRLNCPNPSFSAMMFWGIVHDIHWKNLMNLPIMNTQSIQQYIEYSVDCFLKGLNYQE